MNSETLKTITAALEAAAPRGIRKLDPKLERAKDGLWRPAADSPLRGAAEAKSHPLTARETGPSWLERAK
ncbi:MAG TPA: hypothetical protein VGF13_22885 [Verrucomicrobiae bacterium]|jgi:hypothetical protein